MENTTIYNPHQLFKNSIVVEDIDMFIHDLIVVTLERLQLIHDFQNAWDFFYYKFTMVVEKHSCDVTGRHSEMISVLRQWDKAWAKFHLTRKNASN